jgi:hypothetical protein
LSSATISSFETLTKRTSMSFAKGNGLAFSWSAVSMAVELSSSAALSKA